MALTEKQKEEIAARKAINEAKRNKKPANKQPKKAVESPSEAITDTLEQEATNVLPEEENVPTASVDGLESIKEGQFRVTSEELSEISSKGTELLLNATPEQLAEYGKHSEHGLIYPLFESELAGKPPFEFETVGNESNIAPDCSIDFTNGRSKPAVYTQIGGYNTQEGTYFDKMMREIVYILTLGGKFDRATAPRFSQLPFSCKMKVPLEKYMDYVNRVGYPDYESDGEYYRTTMSAPDFRVLLNFLEQRVETGWEIDPKQACMNKSRYVVPIRTRFPIENTAGLHTRVREPIKYSVEELRSMEWPSVKRIAALHGITDTNHNSVISQLKDIFEEKVDG